MTENGSKIALEHAHYGLLEAEDPLPIQLDPGLPLAIDELRDWLDDDRQWLSPYTQQWISLLDDVVLAQNASGRRLRERLKRLDVAWDELSACRATLNRQKRGTTPDPALRRRLQRAAEAIASELREPETLGLIWDDLIGATSFAEARVEARRLWLYVEAQGLDAQDILEHARKILEDDLAAVKKAREEPFDRDDFNQAAGLEADERASLACSRLFHPARQVDAVLWLEYTLAPLDADRLELGDAVTLYSSSWLRATFRSGDLTDLPPEVRSDGENIHLMALVGIPPPGVDEDEDTTDEGEGEEIPHALVRVALGEVGTAEALTLARETAELIVSLASLQGADPSIWILTDTHVRYYDGREAGASFHRSPVTKPSHEQWRALRSEPIPDFIDEWAEDLPAHLPLLRPDLRKAAQLALWLRRSRESWEPSRIVLCDRVLEQTGGWAGISDRRRFSDEYLRLPWALKRIRLEIKNCWLGVRAARIGPGPALSAEAWEEIERDEELGYRVIGDNGRHTFNLSGVLLRLDFLLSKVSSDTPLHERLTRLRERTRSGKAAAGWVKELLNEFDGFQRRERRLRNALVHGGSVSDEMARSVLFFVDWLAADALYTAIKGMLAGTDPVDHFLDQRQRFERCLAELRENKPPSEVLFWA